MSPNARMRKLQPSPARTRRSQNPLVIPEGASFSVRFRLARNQLTPSEVEVGAYFIAHPESAYCSITEVVEQSGLGYGTIIRFCKKLGCAGFQEFKLLLAVDSREADRERREMANDPPGRLLDSLRTDLKTLEGSINHEVLELAAHKLCRARWVLIGGVASSSPLVLSLDWKLTRLGIMVGSTSDSYSLAVKAANLSAQDVFVAISSSGATKEVIAAAEVARKHGAVVVAVSSFLKSPLAIHADLLLATGADRDPLVAEVPSIVSSEALLELLFITIREKLSDADKRIQEGFQAIADRKL